MLALGSDGLFENVPTLPPAGFAPVRSQTLTLETLSAAQVAGHRQRTEQATDIERDVTPLLGFAPALTVRFSNSFSRNRTYETFSESSRLNEA